MTQWSYVDGNNKSAGPVTREELETKPAPGDETNILTQKFSQDDTAAPSCHAPGQIYRAGKSGVLKKVALVAVLAGGSGGYLVQVPGKGNYTATVTYDYKGHTIGQVVSAKL